MKLKCSTCLRTVCADSKNVGVPCFLNGCTGALEPDNQPPMIGDPKLPQDRWQQVLYHHTMNQKHIQNQIRGSKSDLVPESRRHGLWYHW